MKFNSDEVLQFERETIKSDKILMFQDDEINVLSTSELKKKSDELFAKNLNDIKSIKITSKLISIHPNEIKYFIRLARSYSKLGYIDDAISTYKKI